jgi:phosphoglycolate phosphatase
LNQSRNSAGGQVMLHRIEMKIKAIIFDLDGTLLDTVEDIADATNRMLAGHKFPVHKLSDYIEWVGDGALKLIERALPGKFDDTFMHELLQEYIKIYTQICTSKTSLFKGIGQLLNFLTEQKIPFSILTNKSHPLTLKVAGHYLSAWKFAFIQGLEPDYPKKPHPGRIFEIAEKLHLKPSEIAFIGDSDTDMKTGVAAGTINIGVTWGYDTGDVLLEKGADYIVSGADELINLLKLNI